MLEESYKIMQPVIKQMEKKNVALLALHTSLKDDFALFPATAAVVKLIKYDAFDEKPKEELAQEIELAWEKFRKIIASLSRTAAGGASV